MTGTKELFSHVAEQGDQEGAAALKEIFNARRIRHIAAEVAAVYPAFDAERFVRANLRGLETLSLIKRLRRVAETLHAAMPQDYRKSLGILRKLAPRLNSGFVTMVLPEYVALYGIDDFEASMDALKFFTPFGSSEFAVRHFLRRDLLRTLKVMEAWSRDQNEHVRRLASEGSRPRLPWSFRIEALMIDPKPVSLILDNLKADASLYVRKSVANHLNDITKDNPQWALERIGGWPLGDPSTAWIAKHALRSLIKKGDRKALAIIGAGESPKVTLRRFAVHPRKLKLGGELTVEFEVESVSPKSQRLVIDYAIHYVKKSGATSAKVFKLKTMTLEPRDVQSIRRAQRIRDFTTRTHYMGPHEVEILINGQCLGRRVFDLYK